MKIAFCIPGDSFSGFFLENWTDLVKFLDSTNIEWKLFRNYHPVVFKARSGILNKAKEWNPTHYMWIDSDINFKVEDFKNLCNHNVPIISGLYLMKTKELLSRQPGANGYEFACITTSGQILTTRHIDGQTNLIEVRANGMGWMLVQSNVFNKINNPFLAEGDHSEDILFQRKAISYGYKSMIDPTIIVGHEKRVILK